MEINELLPYATAIIAVIIAAYVIKKWISTYNKFHYWYERSKEAFSDIDVVMQERIDKLHAIAQIVKKYDIHEYKALKDVIEARSKWSKELSLNEKVKAASQVEDNFFKLHAIFYRTKKFPRSIVAKVHGFEPLEYLTFEERETYKPKEIFDDK